MQPSQYFASYGTNLNVDYQGTISLIAERLGVFETTWKGCAQIDVRSATPETARVAMIKAFRAMADALEGGKALP